MKTATVNAAEREERLNAVLLAVVQAIEKGQAPDRQQFLAAYPEFAAELAEFFAGRDCLARWTDPEPAGLEPSAPSADQAPLGDFQLLREVGRGGMGIVYEAQQLSLDRRVALKVLPFAAALDPRHLQRFKNEAHAAALLHHPHIVPIYSVGCDRGVHYYAMQFIEGRSLAAVIQGMRQAPRQAQPSQSPTAQLTPGNSAPVTICQSNTPGPGQGPTVVATPAPSLAATTAPALASWRAGYFRHVAQLGIDAAEALDHAHQQGVVHRDIKPANLLVDRRGNLWITDFGVALLQSHAGLSTTGELVGTLRYMSPEQAGGQRGLVDHRSDVYSLGVTLYELLTLEPPFLGTDASQLLHQIALEEPRPPRSLDPAIPLDLETIILKAIQKNPQERYPTAQALADDLRRFLEDRPIQARRPSLVDRGRKWMRRHPAVVAAAMLLLVVGVIGFALSTALIARERSRTQNAYTQERQRALEAKQRFELARRLANEMIDIANEEAGDDPPQQLLRRRLLLAAVEYYQEFIELRRDDPTAKADLEDTQRQVKNILADLAVMQDSYRHLLLTYDPVRIELKLTEAQKQRLEPILTALKRHEPGPGPKRDFPGPGSDKRAQLLQEMRAHETAIAAILSTAQLARLRQIALQERGLHAFQEPEVVDALKLTRAQRRQLREIIGAPPPPGGPRSGPKSRPDGPGDKPPPGPSKGPPEEGPKPRTQQALAVLTPEQQKRWRELTGDPFAGIGEELRAFPRPDGPPREPPPPR